MPRKKSESSTKERRRAPAKTLESRENQLIELAVDTAERQLREGTAPPSVVLHYLRLGTSREQLDKQKKSAEVELLEAKTNAYHSSERIEELYNEAISAMQSYAGKD
jgi:hypothetical protein